MAIASIFNMENDILSTFDSWPYGMDFPCRSRAQLEIHHISVSLSPLCNQFPEQLRLRFVRNYCNPPVKINGSRAFDRKSSMIILKPDRSVGSDSCQRIYVSTDSVSILGDVAFMVFDNDDTLLSGSLSPDSIFGEKWGLVCDIAVSPLLTVHFAGQCLLGSVTLTESFYLLEARQASRLNHEVEGIESAPASGRMHQNGERRPVQVGGEDTGDGEDSEFALTGEHRRCGPRQPSPSRRQASRRNHEGGGSNSASTIEPGRGGARQTKPRSQNRERKRPSEFNPYAIFGLPIALALILGFILGVAVPKSSYQETNTPTTTNFSLVAINMSNLFNSSNLFNMSNPVNISFPNGASREPRNPPDSATVNCWLRFQQSLWKAVWSTVGFGFRLIKFFFNQLSSILKKLTPSADSATAESRPMFLMRLPQLLLNAGWSAASFGLGLFKFFCDQLSTKLKK